MQPPNPNTPSQPPPTGGGLDQRFTSYCRACPKLEKGSPDSQPTGWGWNRTKKLSQSVDLWYPGGGPDLRELLHRPPVSCSQAESHLALMLAPHCHSQSSYFSLRSLTGDFSNCSAQEPGSSPNSRSYTRQGKRAVPKTSWLETAGELGPVGHGGLDGALRDWKQVGTGCPSWSLVLLRGGVTR